MWAEAWNNGAVGCSLKVVPNYLMELDDINDHSEVSHGQVDLNAKFPEEEVQKFKQTECT